MNKIAKVSRVIRILLLFAAALQLGIWIFISLLPQITDTHVVGSEFAQLILESSFDGVESEAEQLRTAGIDPSLWLHTPPAMFHLVLYSLLFSLFGQYQKGEVFGCNATRQIRLIGMSLVIWPLVELIYPPLIILGFKLNGTLEHGSINLTLGSDDLAMAAAGVMVMVIGWVMAEGARLQKEQELTI